MATSLKFEDKNCSMSVFINQYNKITINIQDGDFLDDFSVIQLENEDVKNLIKELNRLMKINK